MNLEMDVLVKAARTGDLAAAMGGLADPMAARAAGGPGVSGEPPRQTRKGVVPSLDFLLARGFGRKRT